MSNFIIVTNRNEIKDLQEITLKFDYCKVLNLIIIFEKDKTINIVMPNKFKALRQFKINLADLVKKDQQESSSFSFFEDKTSKLNQHNLNIIYKNSHATSTFLQNGKVLSKYTYYLDILAQFMNASLNFIEIVKTFETIEDFNSKIQSEIKEKITRGKLDLSIIENVFLRRTSKLLSRQQQENCFMLEIPPKIAIYEQILILPLDRTCWILLGVVIFISAVVWWIFNLIYKMSSHWSFLFGIYGLFLGQWSEIRV